MNIKLLIGSGRKIGIFFLPFLLVGVALNIIYPEFFLVGVHNFALLYVSLLILLVGIINWVWTVVLLLTKVPRNELISSGPYALVKHPLYAGMSFLVIPWLGFVLNTWMGVILGLVLYVGSKIYAPEEEKDLKLMFDKEWDEYCKKVRFPRI
jgi:protein-S-isoprenylcysteine O-methyltransferase Ste14